LNQNKPLSLTGLMPNNQAMDQVLRRHKTRGAVRAIIMMTSLVQAIRVPQQQGRELDREAVLADVKIKKERRRQTVSLKLPMGTTQDEMHEIGDVFDMYDTDGSGEERIDEGRLSFRLCAFICF
jgi:hypothetical protein